MKGRILLIPFLIISLLTLKAQHLEVELIGSFQSGVFEEGAAEIAAFDPVSQFVFFTNADANTIDIISAANPAEPYFINEIDLDPFGGSVNSVAFSNGIVAVAVEATVKQENGSVLLFDIEGNFLAQYEAGPLPDMITFNKDGSKILVANEGEPNDEYSVDPEGSVTVIEVLSGETSTITFDKYNDQVSLLRSKGIRIFGPNASVAQDLEPEYITVTPDNKYAFVVMQENNAMAKISLSTNEIVDLFPLGLKGHRFDGQGLDASNRTDDIEIKTWPVFGMYQPDAIASFTASDGNQYIVTANEGDARDYDGFSEEARVKDLVLNTTNYPNADELQKDANLGRLKTTTASGDLDGDGTIDLIHSYGGRSFSIWDTDCQLIWDSGDDFEQIIAERDPEHFNSTNDDNDSYKNRSDDKGAEPEAIAAFNLFGTSYVAVGLERMGGMMFYNVSDPSNPVFLDYINNRNFSVDAESPEAGDLGIEDIVYVPAALSPNNLPMLITANEVSGSISFFSFVTENCNANSTVAAIGGGTTIERCVGDVSLEVSFETEVDNDYWYIITDANDHILDYSNRSSGNTLDLSAAPAGVCRIYGWSHDGNHPIEIGEDISNLNIGCNQISDNYIEVNRISDGPCTPGNTCPQPTGIKLAKKSTDTYTLSWPGVEEHHNMK